MSLKQLRFQVTSKLIRPNSWITQTVRQRIPNCWARNGESTSAESAATDARNDELTATGGSQMLATRNRGMEPWNPGSSYHGRPHEDARAWPKVSNKHDGNEQNSIQKATTFKKYTFYYIKTNEYYLKSSIPKPT